MLVRGEVDFILCYDVPDTPQISRLALLLDDLVLVSRPGPQTPGPILFVEALKQQLAMPEGGDTVRQAVSRIASDLGIELKVAYEVRSISAMKNLVTRGAADSILPAFAVLNEVRDGTLMARPIVSPPVRRTLFLASSKQRSPFRNGPGLTEAVRASLQGMVESLGPLAHPL
jgi:LysR family nitrogen assimilation transcriptional regulator